MGAFALRHVCGCGWMGVGMHTRLCDGVCMHDQLCSQPEVSDALCGNAGQERAGL